jgi:exosortase
VSSTVGERGASRRLPERLLIGVIAATALLLCLPTLQSLSYAWSRSEFYTHAFLLPVVAGYLVFTRRREIRNVLARPMPPRLGPLVVFGAAMAEILMFVGDAGFAAGLGVPLVFAACAYAIGGLPLLRPLVLPLLMLAAMVPPPRFLMYALLVHLKLMVTQAAIAILHAMGATVAAEGNQILLPAHSLFVADACSGLISIVTMLPLALVVCYFLSHGVWRRLVVIGSIVPLALAVNILRIVVTVQLAAHLGPERAQGLLHEGFGLATAGVGFLMMVGLARILR